MNAADIITVDELEAILRFQHSHSHSACGLRYHRSSPEGNGGPFPTVGEP
jgi:hypothetical protein